jgi:hypothetical protein
MKARFLEIEERCTAFTGGTYRTHRTYGSGLISPIGRISPIRERGTGCRASKTRAIAPARSSTPLRSSEIRFPDQGVDTQAFGFVFQDHAAGFQHIAVIGDLER